MYHWAKPIDCANFGIIVSEPSCHSLYTKAQINSQILGMDEIYPVEIAQIVIHSVEGRNVKVGQKIGQIVPNGTNR